MTPEIEILEFNGLKEYQYTVIRYAEIRDRPTAATRYMEPGWGDLDYHLSRSRLAVRLARPTVEKNFQRFADDVTETPHPLSAYDTFVATILGGAIAGLVGLGTARYESYLKRREAHFHEHKENFEIVQQALESLRAEVFPLTAKGVDDLRLPRWKEPPFKRQLEKWSIFRYEKVEPIGDTGQFSVTAVDEVLYADIAKHFAQNAELLADLANFVRKEGVELDRLIWEVSHSIYDAMGSSDLSVLKWTFQEGKRTPLDDMVTVDSSEAQSYAGILFLMLTREDPGNWPNTYAQLKEYGLIRDLQAFADTMTEKFGPKIDKLLQLRTELFGKIDDCISTTEQIRHRTRMKGRCQYL